MVKENKIHVSPYSEVSPDSNEKRPSTMRGGRLKTSESLQALIHSSNHSSKLDLCEVFAIIGAPDKDISKFGSIKWFI